MVELSKLRALKFFRTFSSGPLQKIADITTTRSYRANAFIYRQGQPAREIFVMEKGLVSLRSYKAGEDLVSAFELCEPGDLFGAASLLKDQLYTLDAVCLENTDVFVVNAQELSKLSAVDFELGYRLMTEIAQLYFDRYEVVMRELGIPVMARKAAVT